MEKVNIFWFRRDLRTEDNAGLYHALKAGVPVLPLFIFDKAILDRLENKEDARVQFILKKIEEMQQYFKSAGSEFYVVYGEVEDVMKTLTKTFDITHVFANEDYEPSARERDGKVQKILQDSNGDLSVYKDQVIFSKNEILKDDGKPYSVFTPYSRKWLEKLNEFYIKPYPTHEYEENYYKGKFKCPAIPTLADMGFKKSTVAIPDDEVENGLLKSYAKERDFPAEESTSRIGIHLRFGTVSIRALVNEVKDVSKVFLSELIWREFYMMILWQHPHVGRGKAFKPAYDEIIWETDAGNFEKWCQGKTGYPIVDAGMRQLNSIGFMHNRVRMVTASFLAKHLLLDWRLGEAYFAEKLLDYDLSANNGGWQWSSGSGCDAAPYFRIFNPELQAKKFDPENKYIKKWVPEFGTKDYPEPIVDHKFARERCLERYSAALKK